MNYYYYLFSTQTFIKSNIIVFKIHDSILSNLYKLFHIYPIPIRIKIILPQQPFLLFNAEDYWATNKECLVIENFFYCQNNQLQKSNRVPTK